MLARESAELASLALRALSFAGSTTLQFQSRVGVFSTNALQWTNVVSGHLFMSRSWIILQEGPRGQCLPSRWREAQRRRAGLASLTDGIISSDLPLKMSVPHRSSADGVAATGRFFFWLGWPDCASIGAVRLSLSSLDLACLRSSACKSGRRMGWCLYHSRICGGC